MAIKDFRGIYRWLSNFHLAPIKYEGLVYPSTEHAYQAAKTNDPEVRTLIRDLEKPAHTKKIAGSLPLPEDWHTSLKFKVMEEVLREKFSHQELVLKLLATGEEELIEGNTWHDNCWGTCVCKVCGDKGDNHLGKLLMKIRSDLQTMPLTK